MAAATPRLVTRLPVALPTSSHRVPRRQSIRAPCSACLARRRHCSRPLQGETLRCYAATATATAALPDTLDLSLLPSDLAPSNLSVEGKGRVVPVLREIRLLLEDEIGGSEEWIRRVDAALTDLGQRRHGRIAVFGDTLSSPQDVVSALLQDPLVDTVQSRGALLGRPSNSDSEALKLTFGTELGKSEDALIVPSSWLRISGYDVLEVNSSNSSSALSHLFSADLICLVLDPFRLLSARRIADVIPELLARGSVHLVVNGHLPFNSSEEQVTAEILRQLDKLPSGSRSEELRSVPLITFVRANKALRALAALAVGLEADGVISSARTEAFDTFQRQFLRSSIGPLQNALLSTVRAQGPSQLRTAASTAERALEYIAHTISADRLATRTASRTVAYLRRAADQGGVKARHSSVVNRGIAGGTVEGDVQYEMNQARRDLEDGFRGRWGWLSLIGRLRVDDVGSEVSLYLDKRFGRNLERQIVFETGELSKLQESLSTESDHTIRQLSSSTRQTGPAAPHPFSSHLLLNHLQTLSLSIPPFEPTSLLDPIESRRQQLQHFSVPRLQLSVQRALLSSYTLAFLGMSASWAAYVPPLSSLTASTAISFAVLSAVGSVALGQRLWLHAQKRFWRDWTRLTHMLKGDLQTRFSTGIDTQVLAKPLAAADGLEKLVAKRDKRLDELQVRVDELRKRVIPCTSEP